MGMWLKVWSEFTDIWCPLEAEIDFTGIHTTKLPHWSPFLWSHIPGTSTNWVQEHVEYKINIIKNLISLCWFCFSVMLNHQFASKIPLNATLWLGLCSAHIQYLLHMAGQSWQHFLTWKHVHLTKMHCSINFLHFEISRIKNSLFHKKIITINHTFVQTWTQTYVSLGFWMNVTQHFFNTASAAYPPSSKLK